MIAQTGAGAAFTALVWARPLKPRLASALLLLATWVAVLLPVAPEFFKGLGFSSDPGLVVRWLRLAAAFATLAMVLSSRHRWIVVPALIGQACLAKVTSFVTDSDAELEALHLAWFAALFGVHLLAESPRPTTTLAREERRHLRHDVVMGLLAVFLAVLVNFFVLETWMDSSDEWAYTYQAAIFAKLRAYAAAPPCPTAFQNYWIFSTSGRSFSQYTPGWPLFMAPFFKVGLVWLAGPCSLGLLAAGVARLARRVTSASLPFGVAPSRRVIAAAGWISGLAVVASNTLLINGASRFPHVFEAACFAWSIEALASVASGPMERKRALRWGVILGLSSAMMLAVRPPDGATLGLGLLLYFAYAVVEKRLALPGVLAAAASFTALGGLTLVILRLQLGRWFATGYSISTQFFDWNTFRISLPKPNELKYPFPLATGAYCWWPLAPSLGLAGLVSSLRSRERRVAFMLVVGTAAFLVFYMMLEWGRGIDFGYGPRYQLAAVVAMAVGTGVLFAPLAGTEAKFGRTSFRAGGPAALALAAATVGVVRIAPLVYPFNHEELVKYNVFFKSLKEADLHNAVVLYPERATPISGLNATENLPINLYRDQDVIIAAERTPDVNQCVRHFLKKRSFYRYTGAPGNPIQPDPG